MKKNIENAHEKNILIVESSLGWHSRCLENLFQLFKNEYNLSFLVNYPSTNKNNRNNDSYGLSGKNIVKSRFFSQIFFVNLIVYGRQYDYIYVSTGPENNRWSEALNVLAFFVCSLLYGKKMILSLRSAYVYTADSPGLLSFIRNKSVRHIKRISFETKAIMAAFNSNKSIDSKGYLSGLCHNFYSDLLEKNNSFEPIDTNRIRIGLLGSVNPLRRDYALLLDVLEKLTLEERERIELIVLGGMLGEVSDKILKNIADYVRVETHTNSWLSQDQFDEKGATCGLFISNLTESMRYEDLKGSGTVGDAIYFGKRVIIPSYIDKNKEFNEVSIYYDNFSELLSIFKNINYYNSKKVSIDFINEYSTETIFYNMKKDLNLN